MNIFITGTDTNVGKTIVSSILVKWLNGEYFKPIQCGDLERSDTKTVRSLTGAKVHPETYSLKTPVSPHLAGRLEGKKILLENISLPSISSSLIVEGAGGPLVPINQEHFVIDIAKKFQLPCIIVTKNYLGSINHTLLTIEALRARKIKILGLIFNGQQNLETEKIILGKSKLKKILSVNKEKHITPDLIRVYSKRIIWNL